MSEDQHPVDEVRRPIRQILLEERLARLVVALGFLRDRQVLRARIRERSRLGKPDVGAVDLGGGVEQQVHERRMNFVSRQQIGRRGDGREVAVGQVGRDVGDAARHGERGQMREPLRVRAGVHQAHRLQVAPAQELADDRSFDSRHLEHDVDLAIVERLQRVRAARSAGTSSLPPSTPLSRRSCRESARVPLPSAPMASRRPASAGSVSTCGSCADWNIHIGS